MVSLPRHTIHISKESEEDMRKDLGVLLFEY